MRCRNLSLAKAPKKSTPSSYQLRATAWTGWVSCTVSCGSGTQTRSRRITRHPANGGSGCGALSQSRACNQHRCPIHCSWGEWGNWSSCTSCYPGGRSRTRSVTTAAMFGGDQCSGSSVNTDFTCTPTGNTEECPEMVECPTSQYSCNDGLTCIRKHLRCNGDDDCTDYSDEGDCPAAVRKACGNDDVTDIPYIDIAGASYDITLGEEIGTVLDNRQYGGRCSRVRSGEHNQVFRRPANIQSFRFQTHASTTFTSVSYESSKSFYESERGNMERKLEASSSFSFGDIFSLSGGATKTRNSKVLRILDRGTSSDVKYFRVFSDIVLSRFRTMRRSLMLSPLLRRRIQDLPSTYDPAKYSEIIADYGTHFYSSGVLGGRYEYIYRFSKADLRQSGLTDEEQKNCLSTEASFKLLKLFGGKGGTTRCSTNLLSRKHNGSFTLAAKEAISNVIGGQSHRAGALSFFSNNVPNRNAYQLWLDSIRLNPAAIDFTLSPISSIIPDNTKRANLERALNEYLSKYDVTKCTGGCENSGRPVVVMDGSICECLCTSGHSGPACEN
uniref:MACPF domain-containing protein n=1 Tax=Ciona savignyi TaxID=51511 RepID=H2Z9R3_CIOSA